MKSGLVRSDLACLVEVLELSESRMVSNSLPQRGVSQIRIARVNDVSFSATRFQQQLTAGPHLPNDPELLDEVIVVIAFRGGSNSLCPLTGMRRPLRFAIDHSIAYLELPRLHHRILRAGECD